MTYIPEKVKRCFQLHLYYAKPPYFTRSLTFVEALQRILNEAIGLNPFLIEAFKLFTSSIAVQDSQMGIEKARRFTQITQLAFVYIPLSFLSSISGMNVREINGSEAHIWACLIALAIGLVTTLALFWLLGNIVDRRAIQQQSGSRAFQG
jgi:Mg2+ and Co2+ transporter CorA